MRGAVLGMMVGVGLVVAVALAFSERTSAYAQRPEQQPVERNLHTERFDASSQIITLACDAGEGRQQVVLIDPKSRVMGVYHIDRATGKIALKGVRNLQWDLLMDEFNSANPSPREIRSLLPPR